MYLLLIIFLLTPCLIVLLCFLALVYEVRLYHLENGGSQFISLYGTNNKDKVTPTVMNPHEQLSYYDQYYSDDGYNARRCTSAEELSKSKGIWNRIVGVLPVWHDGGNTSSSDEGLRFGTHAEVTGTDTTWIARAMDDFSDSSIDDMTMIRVDRIRITTTDVEK